MTGKTARDEGNGTLIPALLLAFYMIIALCILASLLQVDSLLSEGPTNKFRTFFEILSFVSTALLVPGVAVWAVTFARKQLTESEHIRLALVYIEVNKKYADPDIAASRRKLAFLRFSYPTDKQDDETLAAYVNRVLISYYNRYNVSILENKVPEYSVVLQFLVFVEDIAVLVRRGLISEEFIFDFMGGTLVFSEECLKDHLIWRRGQSHDRALYANALWLMTRARNYRGGFEFDEGDYRMQH